MNINTTLINNIFNYNKGYQEGGAIKWSGSSCPFIKSSNIFNENQAIYGAKIASFPIRMNLIVYNKDNLSDFVFQTKESENKPLLLTNISSGHEIPYIFTIQLIDYYGNIVKINEELVYY